MQPTAYTIARWRVAPGREEAFRTAWVALVETLGTLARPPLSGTLLQHRTESTLFFSFGPWDDAGDIEAFCHDSAAQDAFLRVVELCEEAEPGVFRLVERIEYTPTRPAGAPAEPLSSGEHTAAKAEEPTPTTHVRRALRHTDRLARRSAAEPETPP